MMLESDINYMQRALQLAEYAAEKNEVPIGAVLVYENQIIAESFNQPISLNDPSAHAEMLVLRMGAEKMKNYRLVDTILYTTLEPCLMCAGAMVHARIKRLVFGATDVKAGAVISQAQTLDHPYLNHRISYAAGLLSTECGQILSNFFRKRRAG